MPGEVHSSHADRCILHKLSLFTFNTASLQTVNMYSRQVTSKQAVFVATLGYNTHTGYMLGCPLFKYSLSHIRMAHRECG